MSMPVTLKNLRQLTSELRKATTNKKLRETLQMQYVLSQFRKHKTTDEQLCKAQEELKYVMNTYECYLRSLRTHANILQEFHGRGERTVKETANLVGFKLPHDPK